MKKILFYSFIISIINYHIVVGFDLDLNAPGLFFVRQKTDTYNQEQKAKQQQKSLIKRERNRISARLGRMRKKQLLECLEKEYGKNIVDVKIPMDLEQELTAKKNQELLFHDTKFKEEPAPYKMFKKERKKIIDRHFAKKRRILQKIRFEKLIEQQRQTTHKIDLFCNTNLCRPQ